MKLNLRQTVIDFLKSHPEERFSARKIAQWIFETQREACEEKRKRSRQNLTFHPPNPAVSPDGGHQDP